MLWARGFAQKRSDSSILFEEALDIYFWNVQLGAPVTDHTCLYCLCVKKKVTFSSLNIFVASFSFGLSLYHSQTTWCWKTSWAVSLPICLSSPSLPRQWQELLLWWWMTLCRVGLRWYHLSMKETKNIREKKRGHLSQFVLAIFFPLVHFSVFLFHLNLN